MKKMILYHGTSSRAANEIFKRGGIIPANDDTVHYITVDSRLRTTQGFVYLTDNIKKAFKFGRSRCTNDNSKYVGNDDFNVYIFEIKIDEGNLKPDKDQCEILENILRTKYNCLECSIDNCIKNINSVRCSEELFFKNEVIRYQIWNTRTEKPISEWTLV